MKGPASEEPPDTRSGRSTMVSGIRSIHFQSHQDDRVLFCSSHSPIEQHLKGDTFSEFRSRSMGLLRVVGSCPNIKFGKHTSTVSSSFNFNHTQGR